jgi:hypothetical protein
LGADDAVEDRIVEALRHLVRVDADDSFVILNGEPPFYVQFRREDDGLWCEAVDNEFLPVALQLDDAHVRRLESLGFRAARPGMVNWFRTSSPVTAEDYRDVVRTAQRVFWDVFELPADHFLQMVTYLDSTDSTVTLRPGGRDAGRAEPESPQAPVPSDVAVGLGSDAPDASRPDSESSNEVALTEVAVMLSYRRDDSDAQAQLLFELLRDEPGLDLFMDITIGLGQDFVRVIEGAIERCSVVLAVVGPRWLTVRDRPRGGVRRIDLPDDFVRTELLTARRLGRLVVPVLVGGARMPTPDRLPDELRWFATVNAHELRGERAFRVDARELARALRTL